MKYLKIFWFKTEIEKMLPNLLENHENLASHNRNNKEAFEKTGENLWFLISEKFFKFLACLNGKNFHIIYHNS